MKIITWNLGYWQFRRHHQEAWKYLQEEINPDIALLQEVHPPPLQTGENLLFEEIHNGWGTALYGRNILFNKLILHKHPKRVVAATARMSNGTQIYFASIHAPIINGRVFPHLAHIFDEIEDMFFGHTAIVGGDLNSARLAEKVWPGYGHGPFFERIDQGYFVDCRQLFFPEEIQTIFRPGQTLPFQDDHIFVSQNIANRVEDYRVLHNEITRKVSDHIPVEVALAWSGRAG